MAFSFKGNVDPSTAYAYLADSAKNALLLDVRTQAEYAFVGFPILEDMSRYALVEWVCYPDMSCNTAFVEQCLAILDKYNEPVENIFVLCRSGQRSNAAGQALALSPSVQQVKVYNVASGFEGDRDPHTGHRSMHNGWKFEGLPWQQN